MADGDGLGQLSAFVVADISRRCADHACDSVLLHVFRHIESHHRAFVIKQKLRERPCRFSLADARRPKNINEPTGRFGSCKPARARRTAFATASSASSCPITRRLRLLSIWISFCISPSSIFDTGTPVHFATTSATSSSSTSSFRKTPSFCSSASRDCSASSSFSISGILPY